MGSIGLPSSNPPAGTRVVRSLRWVFQWKYWSPIVYGVAAGIVAVLFMLWLGYLGVYRLHFALSEINPLLGGFYTSCEVVAVILPIGFGIGFVVGWARTSKFLILRGVGSVYVDFFRSLPPIALIVFAFTIGALVLKGTTLTPTQIHNTALWLGVLALALHTGAYQAEIMRAGMLSVPSGQLEAADALGISRVRSMFSVVLPQAFRVSLPALGNEFSSSIKDTSLLFTIGWLELSGVAYLQESLTFETYLYGSLVIWTEVALLYFVLTYIVTRTVRGLEDLYKIPGLEAARV